MGIAKQRPEKRPHKIGSFAIGKINFDKKDHFFHLDERLKRVKSEVKEFVDPDILGLKKSNWNGSSSMEPAPRVDQRKHLFTVTVASLSCGGR